MSEKSPKNIKNTCKTNIYKFRANSKKAQQVNPSPFKSAQVPWTYFLNFGFIFSPNVKTSSLMYLSIENWKMYSFKFAQSALCSIEV